jgi:alpha-amylase/alpha-mannosidase (GH57 family)
VPPHRSSRRPQANVVTAFREGDYQKAFKRLEKQVHHALAVLDEETGKQLTYRQLLQHPKYKKEWSRSAEDEFGRLAQGVGNRIKGTDTIHFIHEHEIPKNRRKDVTYGSFVCTVRSKKADPNRT